MSITITLPRDAAELARMLAAMAEPCLAAAASAAGLGPVGQALVSGLFRVTRKDLGPALLTVSI